MPVLLPPLFLARLGAIITTSDSSLTALFKEKKFFSVRVNTLKMALPEAVAYLQARGLTPVLPAGLGAAALLFPQDQREAVLRLELTTAGGFYPQSLSSQWVPIVLDPQPGERVLDLCAAPGSKTTQMAALMQNQGEIVAVEAVKGRFYRLKSVVSLLGASIVACRMMDGRRWRSPDLFDRILVDAPCGSEGRFDLADPETWRYWSLRKIREMQRKQKGLLLNAGRMLKPGGILVYSTCTFAPEENEAVVDWFLRKTAAAFDIENISVPPEIKTYPGLQAWEGRAYDGRVARCCRILPDERREGFFIARLRRLE
ncbi:MAG: RsmB/NOP family class I SAM-dependent RNA methyltransferase [Candidatus Omnitrophica bacterium]|nr:RsmB/NOP family class I SAM-dependent RNA methyltransferase [Candidatus Omnitrophota bacterium]